jgi:hypothetical protein
MFIKLHKNKNVKKIENSQVANMGVKIGNIAFQNLTSLITKM